MFKYEFKIKLYFELSIALLTDLVISLLEILNLKFYRINW